MKLVGDRRPTDLLKGASLLGAFLARPTEWIARVRSKVEAGSDQSRRPLTYSTSPHYREQVHGWLDVDWPCNEQEHFRAVWTAIEDELAGVSPALSTGHDSDRAFSECLWCLVRHARPQTVLETGVARGVTSRVVLEAMDTNGLGHLWSVDLPPLREPWRSQVGAAVPERLYKRWTYRRGSSRKLLPKLCKEVESLDLFIHDSLHTQKTMLFEYETAYPYVTAGGLLISDDVSCNDAFAEFVRDHQPADSIVASAERKQNQFGLLLKA